MCESLNLQAYFKEKSLRKAKRQISYESPGEQLTGSLKNLELSFFKVVIDNANLAIQERFETLEKVGDNFGVLSTFSTLSNEELAEECAALSSTLQCGGHSDLDRTQLSHELLYLIDMPSKNMTQLDLLQLIHEKEVAEIHKNLWTTLRRSHTLPVTVASAKRSFTKLKLTQTYL